MSWFSGALAAGKLAAKGLNWQVILLKLAIVVGALGTAFGAGVVHQRDKQADIELAEQKVIVKEVIKRVPIIVEKDRIIYEKARNIKETGAKLNEAIEARVDNPACELTDDELREFRKLAEQTKR